MCACAVCVCVCVCVCVSCVCVVCVCASCVCAFVCGTSQSQIFVLLAWMRTDCWCYMPFPILKVEAPRQLNGYNFYCAVAPLTQWIQIFCTQTRDCSTNTLSCFPVHRRSNFVHSNGSTRNMGPLRTRRHMRTFWLRDACSQQDTFSCQLVRLRTSDVRYRLLHPIKKPLLQCTDLRWSNTSRRFRHRYNWRIHHHLPVTQSESALACTDTWATMWYHSTRSLRVSH